MRLRGETIIGIEPPGLGYCHRSIVELIEGKTPDEALPIIERACSIAHESNRIAFCQALEAAAKATVDQTAQQVRVLFAEIERLLARLWTLALVARATNVTPLYRQTLDQRETLFTALESATGVRHYWGVTIPGGARSDIDLSSLRQALQTLEPAVSAWQAAVAPNGLLGRAGKGVGAISAELAQTLDLGGLAGRGSRALDDLRVTQPYACYADYQEPLEKNGSKPTGDVASRLACMVADIVASQSIASAILAELLDEGRAIPAPAKLAVPSSDRTATSAVEGPHGPMTLRYTQTKAGALHNLALEIPAAAAVEVLPQLLEGRLLPQVPLILASLDLCIECLDQ